MRYYADTEFDGFGGPLLSIGIVREDNEAIYIVLEHNVALVKDSWVKENVVPILKSIPSPMPGMAYFVNNDLDVANLLKQFFDQDVDKLPYIIVDWPDDIQYLSRAVITGPGQMVSISRLVFDLVRVDAYPTTLKNAVRHNAYWDAKALQVAFTG